MACKDGYVMSVEEGCEGRSQQIMPYDTFMLRYSSRNNQFADFSEYDLLAGIPALA